MDERKQLREVLVALQQRNQAALNQMEAVGAELTQLVGRTVTCTVPLEARMSIVLELLMDRIAPPHSVHRLKLDIAYEEAMWEQHLEKGPAQAQSELQQFKLSNGGVVVPGQPATSPGGLYVP